MQRHTIQAMIYPGDEEGCAGECLGLAVVTQGKTLDETVQDLREAISLHLEGEDRVCAVRVERIGSRSSSEGHWIEENTHVV